MIAALVLAALVLAFLWTEERGTAAGRARALFFALLAGVVGFVLWERQAERAGADPARRALQAYTEGLTTARTAVATEWWAAQMGGSLVNDRPASASGQLAKLRRQTADLRQRALRSYAEAVRLRPERSSYRRQYAILLADFGQREEALRQFRRLPIERTPHPRSRIQDPKSEVALWEQLYGAPPPRPAALPRLEARLRQLRLGWFEHLVRRSVSQRMGLKERAAAASARAGAEAAVPLLLIVSVVFGTALLGLLVLLGVLIAWRIGKFRPVPADRRAGAAPLLEAFVLYLFLYLTPALLGMVGRAPRGSAPDRSAALIVGLSLATDVLALGALVYLWGRLRPLGLGLSEIGLHGRQLGRNILYGIGGYVATAPLVLGSAFLAMELGRRFFPQVAPPFHPMTGITAVASTGWLRLALLIILAVGAPLLEEIFFRGLLYGALRRRFGIAAGLLGSAALFSLLHPQLPLGFLPIFVLGAAFALLYEWRQSLVPGIVMHALNNGLIWVYLNLLFPPG